MKELEICPPPKKRGPYFQKPIDIAKCIKRVGDNLVLLAEARVHKKITKEMLSPFAVDIYSWRDSINELIKIL
jgi:hypothetical protein